MAPRKSIDEAPGPSGFGLVRALRGLRVDPLGTFSRAAEDFGPIVHFALPMTRQSFHLVHEPEHVRTVLADQAGRYSKETSGYVALRKIVGRGILTADGDSWRAQRRLVTPCLGAARTHTLLDATHSLANELVGRWRIRAAERASIDVRRDMVWLTLGILGRSVFETDARSSAGEVSEALDAVLGETAGSFEDALARLDAESRRLCDAKASGPTKPWDLVGALRAARSGRCPFHRTAGATGPNARDVLLTMLLAGHETTASTLTFALAMLSEHSEAAARVRSEARRELGSPGSLREKVARLSFTRAVVHETLRLYPPVWLVERRAEQPNELGGYELPQGTTLALCLYLAQRKASAWREPDRFVPERFLAESARRELLAFGVGPRGCAGAGFAVDEMTLALAMLNESFRLTCASRVVPKGGVTLRTRDPLVATVSAL